MTLVSQETVGNEPNRPPLERLGQRPHEVSIILSSQEHVLWSDE